MLTKLHNDSIINANFKSVEMRMLQHYELAIPAPRSPEPYQLPQQPEIVGFHELTDEYVLSRAPEGNLSFFGRRRPGFAIVEVGKNAFELTIDSELNLSVGGLLRTQRGFVRDGEPTEPINDSRITTITAAGEDKGFKLGTTPGQVLFFTDFEGEDVRITTHAGLFDTE